MKIKQEASKMFDWVRKGNSLRLKRVEKEIWIYPIKNGMFKATLSPVKIPLEEKVSKLSAFKFDIFQLKPNEQVLITPKDKEHCTAHFFVDGNKKDSDVLLYDNIENVIDVTGDNAIKELNEKNQAKDLEIKTLNEKIEGLINEQKTLADKALELENTKTQTEAEKAKVESDKKEIEQKYEAASNEILTLQNKVTELENAKLTPAGTGEEPK